MQYLEANMCALKAIVQVVATIVMTPVALENMFLFYHIDMVIKFLVNQKLYYLIKDMLRAQIFIYYKSYKIRKLFLLHIVQKYFSKITFSKKSFYLPQGENKSMSDFMKALYKHFAIREIKKYR